MYSDLEICQKLLLPDFLLTIEDFDMIKLPLMRNFIYKQDLTTSNDNTNQIIKGMDEATDSNQYLDTLDKETDDLHPKLTNALLNLKPSQNNG
jgi:hypothetical protein